MADFYPHKKRACVYFNSADPKGVRCWVMEAKDKMSPKLRRAIERAEKVFWEEYQKPDALAEEKTHV